MESKIHHIALFVPDIKKTLALFQNVFGMKVTEIDGTCQEPAQIWLDGGIQLIAAPEQSAASLAHVAVTAASPPDLSRTLQQVGAEVLPRGINWIKWTDGLVIELMPGEEET